MSYAQDVFDRKYEEQVEKLENDINKIVEIKKFLNNRSFANKVIEEIQPMYLYNPNAFIKKEDFFIYGIDDVHPFLSMDLKKAKKKYSEAIKSSNMYVGMGYYGDRQKHEKIVSENITFIKKVQAETLNAYLKLTPFVEDIVECCLVTESEKYDLSLFKKNKYRGTFDDNIIQLTESLLHVVDAESAFRLSKGSEKERNNAMDKFIISLKYVVEQEYLKQDSEKIKTGYNFNFEIENLLKTNNLNETWTLKFNKVIDLEHATNFLTWVYKSILKPVDRSKVKTSLPVNKNDYYSFIRYDKQDIFKIISSNPHHQTNNYYAMPQAFNVGLKINVIQKLEELAKQP